MATGAITAIDGAGSNQALAVRGRADVQAHENRAASNAQPTQVASAIPAATTLLALNLSTRVALDPKTLRAYIQTVADQPDEPVIHSYPALRSESEVSTFIILA